MLLQTIKKVDKFKDLGIDLTIYQGANWCDLPRDAAVFCLQFLKDNPRVYEMLKTGFCSDEVVCQTVLGNSEYMSRIQNDNHRYVNWTKKNGSYPAILDGEDYAKIAEGDYHFVRKVDRVVSRNLLERLNRGSY